MSILSIPFFRFVIDQGTISRWISKKHILVLQVSELVKNTFLKFFRNNLNVAKVFAREFSKDLQLSIKKYLGRL